MTCIIAMEHEEKVYMGCDSAASSGWNNRPTVLPKVFQVGDFLIGYTSSFRMGQLLQYHLKVREREEESSMRYMVTGFVPAMRECLKEGGYAKVENNQEEIGFFLVGYQGRVYTIADDMQVNRYQDGMSAVGCGANYALATLATLQDMDEKLDPEKAIMKSLEIAGRFSNGVSGPYTVTCS